MFKAHKRAIVSGKTLAGIICLSCLFPLVIFPLALKLPKWIEAEVVIGSWAIIWGFILSFLLYKGWHVEDDHHQEKLQDGAADAFSFFDADFSEGFGGVVASIVISVVVALLVYLFIQTIFPAVAFLGYFVIIRMLRTVANDAHGCEANVFKAMPWGFFWAILYTGPLMLLVWAAHHYLKSVA